jgi:hypothetical protein
VDDARVANCKLHSVYDRAFGHRIHWNILLTARVSKNIRLTSLAVLYRISTANSMLMIYKTEEEDCFSFAMAKASGQVQVTFGVTAANTACTRLVGVCSFFSLFRGLELVPLK